MTGNNSTASIKLIYQNDIRRKLCDGYNILVLNGKTFITLIQKQKYFTWKYFLLFAFFLSSGYAWKARIEIKLERQMVHRV